MRIIEVTGNDIVSRAKDLAMMAHMGQKYGDHPYMHHLADVARRVATITDNPEIVAAAWLHDIVEDTSVTVDYIRAHFGDNVARMVWAVTGEGTNRQEKLASAIQKIKDVPGSELVKSADRLSNVTASMANNPKKLKMYRDEHDELSTVLGTNELAKELLQIFKD